MDGGDISICGNGIITTGEQCDDGNTRNGDCCSSTCQYEAAGSSCDDLFCWNGNVNGICDGAGTCNGSQPSQSGQCIVFLTSETYYGDFGGLAGADANCQRLADEEGLPGTYKAWLSDTSTSAADRLTHSSVPYVRVDNQVVASNWQDLVDGGGLTNAISVSEGGYDWYGWCVQSILVPGSGSVWTATSPGGILERETCLDWSSTNAYAGTGVYCLETDDSWTRFPADILSSLDCWHARSLYCFQQ